MLSAEEDRQDRVSCVMDGASYHALDHINNGYIMSQIFNVKII